VAVLPSRPLRLGAFGATKPKSERTGGTAMKKVSGPQVVTPANVAARAPRLWDLAPIEQGTLAYVQEATGRPVASTHEDIYAREADDLDALHGVGPVGRPVLVVEFVAYDADERPLTFETAVFPERVRVLSGTRPSPG